ncbi:MAG: tetratricopeptide repeat protein [Candidatus Sumerlaeota bacterium]|nr:tetratricopeptide repeat protein [Candidatus Sumerlaeota bacterium]
MLCAGAVAALSLALIPSARATDTVRLTNGNKLSGTIISETSGMVEIETSLGRLSLKRAEILSVSKGAPAETTAVQPREAAAMDDELRAAENLIGQRNLDEAQARLEEIQRSNPTDAAKKMLANIHYLRAQQASDRQNSKDKERELKIAIEINDQDYRPYLDYGDMLLKIPGGETTAIETITKGLELGKDNVAADQRAKFAYLVARKQIDMRKYEDAAMSFARCVAAQGDIQIYSDAPKLTLDKLKEFHEYKLSLLTPEMIKILEDGLKKIPSNTNAMYLLGNLYRDSGETTKAIQTLKQLINKDDQYAGAYYALARAYFNNSEYEKAKQNLDAEIGRSPNNFDAIADRTEMLIALNNIKMALEDLTLAKGVNAGVNATDPRVKYLEAKLNFMINKNTQAVKILKELQKRKRDSQLVEAHILMGQIALAEKKPEDAKKWLEPVSNSLDKLPRANAKARIMKGLADIYLAEADLQQNTVPQAETKAQEALKIMPNYIPAILAMGRVLQAQGEAASGAEKEKKLRNALEQFNRAKELNPKDPETHLALGDYYRKAGNDPKKAKEEYDEYIKYGGRDKTGVNKLIDEAGGGGSSTAPGGDNTTSASAEATTTPL